MKAAAETAAIEKPRLGLGRVISAQPLTVVCAAAGGWIVAFLTIAVRHYDAFRYHRFDLGNMTQAVFNTAHGHLLEVTEVSGDQMTRLGAHVDPLLAVFAPLWWLWPSPLMLVTVQIVAVAVGALPVFWLARKHLESDRTAMHLALVYLLYPAVQWRALNEFHPATVAIPILLLAIWFLDEEKFVRFGAFALLAVASQEQMGLLVGGLGVWYALRRRNFMTGAVIAAAGVGWTIVAMRVVIPHFSGGPSPFYSRYATVGGSPGGILHTFLRDPLTVVRAALTQRDLGFLYSSFMPLLGLFVLAPTLSMIAVPQLLLSLLSDRVTDTSLDGNIFSPVIPFLVAATDFGISKLRQPERFAKLALAASAFSAVLGPFAALRLIAPATDAHARAAAAAVEVVPRDAPVAATNELGSRLSARRRIYSFPFTGKADWVAVDLADPVLPTPRPAAHTAGLQVPRDDLAIWPKRFRREVAKLRHDPRWRLVFHREGVLVWRRV